jgi:hypothetical protein
VSRIGCVVDRSELGQDNFLNEQRALPLVKNVLEPTSYLLPLASENRFLTRRLFSNFLNFVFHEPPGLSTVDFMIVLY